MLRKLYALRDTVSGDITSIFQSPNDATAIRSLRNWFKQDDMATSPYVTSPLDFTLISVCELDLERFSCTPMMEDVAPVNSLLDLEEQE